MVSYKQGESHSLLVFIYSWLWCSICIYIIAANDSLKPGDTLNVTGQLCSEKNQYCINFYPINPYLPVNYTHLSITYIANSDGLVPWVANRNQPVDKDYAVLMLDHSGVLKIESTNIKPIILYAPTQPLNNTIATLLDSGNFVVQQLHPNGTKTLLWQSFDHPTDTLLPGMKLGLSHKTGHNWSLISWLTSSDPRLGAFKLEWEPKRRELIIKNRGQLCWSSGELRNDNGSFQNTQYMIVSNEDESYLAITTSTWWSLLQTGQFVNGDIGDVARADMCYGYNTDGGCQKWEDIPTCRHRGDIFEQKEAFVNTNLRYDVPNSSYGPSDCQAICWKNCTCDGFTLYFDNGTTGCRYLHLNSTEGVTFATGGEKFYILVKNTQVTKNKGKKKWIWITIIILVALFVICAFILLLAFKRRIHWCEASTTSNIFCDKDLEDEFKKRQDLKVLSYTTVLLATNDFSPENKLGQGGFGPVYKGILPTGQEAAIKRLSKTSRQGIVEFKNELLLICELQHMNLVQLLGCCIHEEERILIYEYMPNKSLDFYLFDCTKSKLLDWKKRFNIIEGISQGILYLHKYSRLKVIHRDLKASNILLDENMNPKISDFGLARMFAEQEPATSTSRIIGTYGYMSPEYAMEGIFSTKSDVYSFGVLILEIVSGRRNTSLYDNCHINLIGHAWELWNRGESLRLMDPSLNDLFDPEEAKRCIHIGLLCIEQNADDRPTVSHLISMLTNESAIVALPRRPAFYAGKEIFEGNTSSKETYTDSAKEKSLSGIQSS